MQHLSAVKNAENSLFEERVHLNFDWRQGKDRPQHMRYPNGMVAVGWSIIISALSGISEDLQKMEIYRNLRYLGAT
jgi:Na+-transporting NADH:ubiquinone oxidoreductase subunit NqrE